MRPCHSSSSAGVVCLLLSVVLGSGCIGKGAIPVCVDENVPRELAKTTMPPYVIESPDILLIDAVRVVPLPPYRVQPLDQLLINVTNTLPNEPIAAIYPVDVDGTVNLGLSYGSIRVVDMTLEEARKTLEKQLAQVLKSPQVQVALAQSRALQQIRGEHLVRGDGTVGLGVYGNVPVVGLTIPEAKAAIEQHLSQYLYKPEVAVDVFAYNSKFYYVITDGAGLGEQVYRLPATGNETVLDALSQINGLPAVASKSHIWVARPSPEHCGGDQALPVDWCAITRGGSTSTNYQVFPGDRIYVQAQSIITFDTYLARLISPIERVFGVTLLAETTIRSFERNRNNFNNTPFLP